jgi:hypothetical protein
MSSGEWVQFLDADDYLLPEKIAIQMQALKQTRAELVASPCIRDSGAISHWGSSSDPWMCLFRTELGITSSNLWHRQAIDAAGLWNPEQPCCQEYELMQRILMSGAEVCFVPEPLTVCRNINPDSIFNRSRSLGYLTHVQLVREGLEFLRSRGELTEDRIDAAAHAILKRAQGMYRLGGVEFAELEQEALGLSQSVRSLLREERPVYRALYRVAGLRGAEQYRSWRRKWRRAARQLVPWLWPEST